jgi:hypothetical protein
MVEEKPCSYALEEYFKKLWLPTPVATIDIVINHQEKRRPLKKKSWVVLLYLAKKDPNPKTSVK